MKKIIPTILIITAMAGLVSCAGSKSSEDNISMIVGTYTSNGSHGIYSLGFDQENGNFTFLDSLSAVNPSFVTFSPDGSKIYAVNEVENDEAGVSSINFDKATGKMTLVNGAATHSGAPCYISTNGKFVATANYGGGSISIFPLAPDGSLLPLDTLYMGAVGGPDSTRQEAPHVHCVEFSPDGKYLYASDFSADRLLTFKISDDGAGISPVLNEDGQQVTVPVEPDYGPRHIIFDSEGKHAYVIGELSGKITVFDYNNGKLVASQVVDADPYDGRGSADIHLSPDGKFLYASNRLKGDGIAIFSVNTENGQLTDVGYQSTGIHPRHFNITPNGKYLLVACRDTNEIEVYQRDSNSGLLTPTGEKIHIPSPVCVLLLD